jgi:hypothetical protein
MALGMHGSETLQNEVFGSQPNYYDLEFTREARKMLEKLGGSLDANVREAISRSRIPSLLAESMCLSEGTAENLAGLRAEVIVTDGMRKYYCQPVMKMVSGSVLAVLSREEYQFPFPAGDVTPKIQLDSADSNKADAGTGKDSLQKT